MSEQSLSLNKNLIEYLKDILEISDLDTTLVYEFTGSCKCLGKTYDMESLRSLVASIQNILQVLKDGKIFEKLKLKLLRKKIKITVNGETSTIKLKDLLKISEE